MILTPFKFKSTPSSSKSLAECTIMGPGIRFSFFSLSFSLLSSLAWGMDKSEGIEFVVVVIHNDHLLVGY